MASNDYMTPGSAVADTVQQILQKRREQERQMLLDKLTVDKYQTDQDHWNKDYSLRQNQDSREAALNDVNIADKNQTLHHNETADLSDNADPTQINTGNPDLYKYLKTAGRIKTVTPSVSSKVFGTDENGNTVQTDAGVTDSGVPKEVYSGSTKFMEQEAARKRIQDFIAGHPDAFKNNPELATQLALLQTGAIDKVTDEVVNPAPSVTPIHENGHPAPSVTLPRGGHAMELNPPQPNAANSRSLWQFNGPNGQLSPFIGTPDEAKTYLGQHPELTNARHGNEPTTATKDIIPASALNALSAAMKIQNTSTRTRAVNTAMQNVIATASQHNVSPTILDALPDIMANIDEFQAQGKQVPVDQIIARITHDDGSPLDPTEQAHARAIIAVKIGAQVK